MKCGILFSGGKDSTYAAYLVKKYRNEISCLITLISENPESYMFHIPNIELVKLQAESMGIPLIFLETEGVKEEELKDLKEAIEIAKEYSTEKSDKFINGLLDRIAKEQELL